ncbi:selenide,water dikinase [Campylobacter upsaliensis]|uniref:Selenide,water dikinase n=2 Tax=Campylobacter upsaliensis TaxID=28080 RepID=A0A381EG37_CAMUP|nr:selenide,water dikinase [Campylobacter upsaliensis]
MQTSPALLSSIGNNEDASVYQISEDLALVQTLDFITPVVDSAYHFGAIAAANALSDIFAMGAEVINALNIVGFDNKNHNLELLGEILAGANDKVQEAGGIVVGGHTIESAELFFGLSVTGKVHPKQFIANNTAQIGDVIILTKPLGIGILSTALKGGLLEKTHLNSMLEGMLTLNLKASRLAVKFKASAMSDVTGFGLLGHLKEMLNPQISIRIFENSLPLLRGVRGYFDIGLIPAGAYQNYEFIKKSCPHLQENTLLFCSPETSGGLLIALDEKNANALLKALQDEGINAAIIALCESKGQKELELI